MHTFSFYFIFISQFLLPRRSFFDFAISKNNAIRCANFTIVPSFSTFAFTRDHNPAVVFSSVAQTFCYYLGVHCSAFRNCLLPLFHPLPLIIFSLYRFRYSSRGLFHNLVYRKLCNRILTHAVKNFDDFSLYILIKMKIKILEREGYFLFPKNYIAS